MHSVVFQHQSRQTSCQVMSPSWVLLCSCALSSCAKPALLFPLQVSTSSSIAMVPAYRQYQRLLEIPSIVDT